MSSRAAPPAPTPRAERVVGLRKTPNGSGQQYEILWQGRTETTWEAASRVRRQHAELVRAFEGMQQQQQQQQLFEGMQQHLQQQQRQVQQAAGEAAGEEGSEEGAAGADEAAAPAVAADGSSMRAQMEAMQQLLREQAQQLQLLRGMPAPSPVAAATPTPAEQPSRFARKEPRAQDLREYDGAAGAKLDEWLDELGAAVDLFRLNGREAADFGTSRLRGAARQWWNTLGTGRASVNSADELARALRARFQPVTTERVAREQLRALRQGNRGINEFIGDFQRLRALLPDMSEADALFAFESGLNPALALELRKQGSARLADAISLAARIGGITAASAVGMAGRASAASAAQMEIDDGDGASLDDRITRAVVNAMGQQQPQGGSGSFGFGAKAQTHRGYSSERGRSGARGGRGGRIGEAARVPKVPGVPAAIVEQRRAAGQCYRCGSSDHTRFDCTKASTAAPQGN
jgi:hypothetical protein